MIEALLAARVVLDATKAEAAARDARLAAMRQAGVDVTALYFGVKVLDWRPNVMRQKTDLYPLKAPRSPTYWDGFKPFALPLFYAIGLVSAGAICLILLRLALGPMGP